LKKKKAGAVFFPGPSLVFSGIQFYEYNPNFSRQRGEKNPLEKVKSLLSFHFLPPLPVGFFLFGFEREISFRVVLG